MTFDEWWNNEDNDWARDQNPVRAMTLKNLAEAAWDAALSSVAHITRLVGDPPDMAENHGNGSGKNRTGVVARHRRVGRILRSSTS